MPHPASSRIHPTAIISSEAVIGENVSIGPQVIIEGKVEIGPDCEIRPHVCLFGPLKMGRGNKVYSGTVIGERPQHMKYDDEPTGVEIGDDNVFRENVTIHRATTHSWVTRLGSSNFLMAGAHVAHDCQVGNRCILVNNALVGGHCVLEDGVYLSGNSAVGQFCRIGRLAFLSGTSATTKDMPPFIIQQGFNVVYGVNVVGMRRAGMPADQINAVRQAYQVIFRQGLTLPLAMARLEKEMGTAPAVRELLDFLNGCSKGVNSTRTRGRDQAA
jgi:UDP-N-acetylglucosamine acyltransferase